MGKGAVCGALRSAGLGLGIRGEFLGSPRSSGTSWPTILSDLPQLLPPLEARGHLCRAKFGTHQVLVDLPKLPSLDTPPRRTIPACIST